MSFKMSSWSHFKHWQKSINEVILSKKIFWVFYLLCAILCTAQIQQLKHSISKGDKKKKKDITAQIAVLEAELEARHEQELQAFKDEPTAVSYYCISLSDFMCCIWLSG